MSNKSQSNKEAAPISHENLFMRVFAVSYEGSLFGWNLQTASNGSGLEAKLVYGFLAAAGALKSVAVSSSGKMLALGGSDDKIHLYDTEVNRDRGILPPGMHQGSLTVLRFVGNDFLLSGALDGKVVVWRTRDWQAVHTLEGHSDAINGIAIHPSGKLALSASRDKTLKMWNLVQGRCAFTKKVDQEVVSIAFDKEGLHYFLAMDRMVKLLRVSDNAEIATLRFTSRVNAVSFVNANAKFAHQNNQQKQKKQESSATSVRDGDCIAVALEDKSIELYDLSGVQIGRVNASFLDGSRIRDIIGQLPSRVDSEEINEILSSEGDSLVLVTSNGSMGVLSVRAIATTPKGDDEEAFFAQCLQASHSITVEPRLTCVAAWADPKTSIHTGKTEVSTGEDVQQQQRQEEEEEEEDEEESEEVMETPAIPVKTQEKKRKGVQFQIEEKRPMPEIAPKKAKKLAKVTVEDSNDDKEDRDVKVTEKQQNADNKMKNKNKNKSKHST